MAWWTRAAAVAVVSGNGGKAERDQRSHHHADRPVQVGLHRRSSAQENARFRDGQIVSASATAAPDAGTSDCDSYPVMALIISDSVADYPNVLLCRSNWGLLIAEQVYPGSRTACAADARPIGQVAGSVLVRDGSPDRATVHRGQSLLRVLERRQRLKPVLCPARQHNLVVGELEAVVTDNHHVGAHAQEATN